MDFDVPVLAASTGYIAAPATIDDAAEMLELERRVETDVAGETALTLDEISKPFATETGRANTAAVVVRRGDALVGSWGVEYDNADRYYAKAIVDHGLESDGYDALIAVAVQWAEQTVRGHATGDARLKLYTWDGDSRLREALTTAGYALQRSFFEMHIDLPAADTAHHSDVSIRRADLGDGDTDDTRLVHHLVTETFRDHYDFIERPFEDWVARHRDNPHTDYSSWWIAEVDGQPAGVRIDNSAYVDSHNAAYIANLGTLRSARGRGVAKSLLAHSFDGARRQGRAAVKLHVDAESPTGATRLYEAVGMRRNHTEHEWQKVLPTA